MSMQQAIAVTILTLNRRVSTAPFEWNANSRESAEKFHFLCHNMENNKSPKFENESMLVRTVHTRCTSTKWRIRETWRMIIRMKKMEKKKKIRNKSSTRPRKIMCALVRHVVVDCRRLNAIFIFINSWIYFKSKYVRLRAYSKGRPKENKKY